MAAVAATAMVGASALFMMTWNPDPIASAMAPAATQLALNDGPATVRGARRIYPYSVIPGGVSGQAELKRVIRTDRVVASHYATFDVDKARPVAVAKPREVYVSYRKGGQVFWTAHKVKLAEGETLLSDGRNEMRARCANRISDVAQYPVEPHRPAMEELDEAVELDEGEEYALGPDGLPVSSTGPGGIPRHTGQRAPGRGGSGISGPAATGQGDTMLASSGAAPSAGISSAMGMSGSSSSTSNRPRPVATPPASPSTNPDTSGSEGSGGSSSGSQPPLTGGLDPVPVPDTGTAVPSPPPEPEPVLPPATNPPVKLDPTPQPAPELPVFTPDPLPQPGVPQTGGGGTEGQPPTTPSGPGPLFPPPGGETGPLIPKPDLKPPPPLESTEEPEAPAQVPEPGSPWLFGGALAALMLLRRRSGINRGS